MNEDSPLEQKARTVRKNWFDSLPGTKQDEVIKPAFEKEFPSNEQKREATKRYKK